jgi:uncharacterized DUF497 family protein
VLILEFEVDDTNLQHLTERGVTLEDLDAMLETPITVICNKRHRAGAYKFVGRGHGGRMLTVVVARTSTADR